MIGPVIFPRHWPTSGSPWPVRHGPTVLSLLPPCIAVGLLEEYRKWFWRVFQNPRMETERFKEVWSDLEFTLDLLAGPLHTIYENGECDYVFNDRDRFPTVHNPDTFLAWCLSLAADYRNGALEAGPRDEAERKDRATLLETAEGLERMSRMAYEIVNARWRQPTV